jgi:hypothetical protein
MISQFRYTPNHQSHKQSNLRSDFKYKHDFVRDVIFNIFRRAGISVKKEVPVNFLTNQQEGRSTLRPTDVMRHVWVGGKHACVYLTWVSPLIGLGTKTFTVGQADLKAASCKVAKHEKTCSYNQHTFIPFAFDTFGFLAPEAESHTKNSKGYE